MRYLHTSYPQNFKCGHEVNDLSDYQCIDGATIPAPDEENFQSKQPACPHDVEDLTPDVRDVRGGKVRYGLAQHLQHRKHPEIRDQKNARLPLEPRENVRHEIAENDQHIVDELERYQGTAFRMRLCEPAQGVVPNERGEAEREIPMLALTCCTNFSEKFELVQKCTIM